MLSQSTIRLTFNNAFILSMASNLTLLYIKIIVPNDVQPINNTCILSLNSALCNLTAAQTFIISNLGDFSSQLQMSFNCATNYFINSSSFDIKLYYNTNIVSSNFSTTIISYCSSPCKKCTLIKTDCLSCLPLLYTSNITLFSGNNTCVASCPATYYLPTNGLSCVICNQSICLNCQNTATNCTSCSTNSYLYQNSCPNACPNTFYSSNSPNVCLNCISPCFNCTSATICITCISNYYLDTDNTCQSVCKNTSYIGLGGKCQLCTNNCITCSVSLSNCTSCN